MLRNFRPVSFSLSRPVSNGPVSNGPPRTPLKKKRKEKTLVIRRQGEYMYGVGPCTAALQAKRRRIYAMFQKVGCIEKKAASKRMALGNSKMHNIAEELKVDYNLVDKDTLNKLTGNRPHQGIVLDVAPLNSRRMDATDCRLSEKEWKKNPIWVLLDQIQDPMNFGAILRCCYYLGVNRVITSKRCCLLSPAVSKASAGAMELMAVHSVNNLGRFLKEAKAEEWTILGTSGPVIPESGEEDEDEEEWEEEEEWEGRKERRIVPSVDCRGYIRQGPTLLVLGNEGHGLHREVEDQCDVILTVGAYRELPLGFDSLNVGVAAGILLHSLQRPTMELNNQ